MSSLANFLLFQASWFACVLGVAHGRAWAGTLVVLFAVAWHLARAQRPFSEAALAAVCACVGALWDSLVVANGWIEYSSGVLIEGTAPYWIVALWMLFATTLNASLGWLRRSSLLAAVFGAIGAPLSYLAAEKIGALDVANEPIALVSLGAGWALILPALLSIARRLEGGSPRVSAPARVEVRGA